MASLKLAELQGEHEHIIVLDDDESVCCDCCNKWIHVSCDQGLSSKEDMFRLPAVLLKSSKCQNISVTDQCSIVILRYPVYV